MPKVQTIAKAIFEGCQEEGIEDLAAYDKWDDTSEDTRDLYTRIAVKVLDAMQSAAD